MQISRDRLPAQHAAVACASDGLGALTTIGRSTHPAHLYIYTYFVCTRRPRRSNKDECSWLPESSCHCRCAAIDESARATERVSDAGVLLWGKKGAKDRQRLGRDRMAHLHRNQEGEAVAASRDATVALLAVGLGVGSGSPALYILSIHGSFFFGGVRKGVSPPLSFPNRSRWPWMLLSVG